MIRGLVVVGSIAVGVVVLGGVLVILALASWGADELLERRRAREPLEADHPDRTTWPHGRIDS